MKCIKSGSVKGYGGIELHGWFFNWLRSIYPELSTQLHENNEEKPFVIGPLYGIKRKGRTFLEENQEYSFAISGLNQTLKNVLNELLANAEGTIISINNALLKVQSVSSILPGDGLSYYDILENEDIIKDNITLQFASPTSFRQQGTQELFPKPELVFGSLLRKWNAFSPVKFADDLVHSKLLVKKYNLKTEIVDYGKYKIIGCTGRCTYQLDKHMPLFQKKMLHSLAYFAEYAGVGYKTSMGLGDVRFISHDRR